jgi:hypothetical protein
MYDGWDSPILEEGSGAGFGSNLMPPEVQRQDQFPATFMDRSKLSGSSVESRLSADSYQDQNYAASPLSSYSSLLSEGGLTRRGSQYETPQTSYLSPETAVPSRESGAGLPLFNIERDGDPNIKWWMYYDFIVSKAEAYYQLQPDYLPTEKYPLRVRSEKVDV